MGKAKEDRRLSNPRHEVFCHLFVFGHPDHDPEDPFSIPNTFHNATQSYLGSGYKATGPSATKAGSRLLSRVDIQNRIGELRKDQTRIKTAFLEHWKSMLPDAQDVLRRAIAGEEVSPQALTAARDIIEQAQGPTRLRFGIDKGADTDTGISVVLWSGRKE